MMTKPSPSLPWRTFALILLTAVSAWACSVPVFRYALEHWEADPFQLIVFHRGELTSEQQAQVQSLKPAADATKRANLHVSTADVTAEMSPDHAELWKRLQELPADIALPRVVLRYPRSRGNPNNIVSASLAEVAALNIADSPARSEILERLGDGQSAVWVLLESGDAARDDAAAKVLEARLDYLMTVLTLPELDQLDIANGLVSVGQDELRLEFSMLRVSRTDAQERSFIPMLLCSEPDLASLKEPMVFPIFGRGRALYALVGKGIAPETIEEAATFLIGKCSCQVKEQNPGTDLLFTADWKKLAQASPLLERELPNLAHLAKAAVPVTVTTQPQAASVSKKGLSPRMMLLLLVAVIGAALVVKKIR